MQKQSVIIDLEKITNTCFIIMPFRAHFEAEYDRVIRPAVEEVGLECVRGDEIYTKQAIIQDIWYSIRKARIIIAELSGRNPNVMYEIGLAHAIGKPIILLTRNQDDVPFDLKSLRYLFYDPDNPFWGDDLRSELVKMLQGVLSSPSLQTHLESIEINTTLPESPTRKETVRKIPEKTDDFYGVWKGKWYSIKTNREHNVTLVIPKLTDQINATMTVTYIRKGEPTVVQETLSGTMHDELLSLMGVSFTYIQRGNSSSYFLDSFELRVSEDGKKLEGKVKLKNGTRDIIFDRVS
jgi:hypothetical protein